MASLFAGRMLNREVQFIGFALYQENAFAFACVERLQSQVIRHGFSVMRGDHPSTPEFQKFVDYYYGKFVKDCVMSFLLYGFVAFDIQERSWVRIPVVISGTHVRVHGSLTKARILLSKLMNIITQRKIEHFYMLNSPDLVNMRIESAFTKIVPFHVFETVLVQNAIVCDKRAAETPMVLENLTPTSGTWAMRDFDYRGQEAVEAEDWREMGGRHSSRVGAINESLIRMQDNYVKSLNTIGNLDSVSKSQFIEKKDESLPRMQLPPQHDLLVLNFLDLVRICAIYYSSTPTAFACVSECPRSS